MRSKRRLKAWVKVTLFIVGYLIPILLLISINKNIKKNPVIINNSYECIDKYE